MAIVDVVGGGDHLGASEGAAAAAEAYRSCWSEKKEKTASARRHELHVVKTWLINNGCLTARRLLCKNASGYRGVFPSVCRRRNYRLGIAGSSRRRRRSSEVFAHEAAAESTS